MARSSWKMETTTVPPHMRRKPRKLEDLTDDPALLFHAHYLVGATSMAAYWMVMQEDPQVKAMGQRLGDAVNWFYEPEKKEPDKWDRHPTMPPLPIPKSEETTEIRSSKT